MAQFFPRCPQCGAPRAEGAKFCRACGEPLQLPLYAYPRPVRRVTRPKLLPIVLIALAVVVLAAAVYWGRLAVMGYFGRSPQKVVYGKPLAWRSIRWARDPSQPPFFSDFGSPFFLSRIAIGDFDGDGDDEVFVYNDVSGANLVQLDGKSTFIPQKGYFTFLEMVTWDYDGDGCDNLLDNVINQPFLQVYDLQGNVIAKLRGNALEWHAVVEDFDGDGRKDLLLHDPATDEYVAYAPGGKEIWRTKLPPGTYNPGFGDVDGDHKCEMIIADNGTLRISGIGRRERRVAGWQGDYCPDAVIDLDGDGCGEVFAGNCGFRNLARGSFTELRYGANGKGRSTDLSSDISCMTLSVNGQCQLVTRGLNNYSMNSELFMFDVSGACTYEERMGEPITEFGVASEANGREHIVVLNDSKLLIAP